MMRPHILHGGLHQIGDQPGHFIDPDHFLGRSPFDDLWMSKAKRPLTNISKTDDAFLIELALPGYSKEEFSISVTSDILTIRAEKKTASSQEAVLHRQEFNMPSFHQAINLPSQIDTEAVEAKLEQGILHLRLPLKVKKLAKTIPVQ